MRTVLCTLLWAILGLFVGTVTGILIGLAWITVFQTSSFEGYSAMLVFFGFAPAGAIVGMILLPIGRGLMSKQRGGSEVASEKSASQG